MSSYEVPSLNAVDAVLDALDNPTSEEVWRATLPYSERAIAATAARRADIAGGGSSAPTDWLRIENQNGQTLALLDGPPGAVSGPVQFDTVTEQSGSAIGWDVGSPAAITLTAGWYSLCATVFLAPDPGGTGQSPQGSVGFIFSSPWIDEIPVCPYVQPPDESTGRIGHLTMVITVPHVRIPGDDTLNLLVAVSDFTNAAEVTWAEFAVVRISDL